MFSLPANSYNFHEASRWKAQSSRRIGNFARHLLMHECVSSDERSKNEIEYYANANGCAKLFACDIGTRASCRSAKSLSVITRKNRSARKDAARAKISPFTGNVLERAVGLFAGYYFIKHLPTQLFYTLPICKGTPIRRYIERIFFQLLFTSYVTYFISWKGPDERSLRSRRRILGKTWRAVNPQRSVQICLFQSISYLSPSMRWRIKWCNVINGRLFDAAKRTFDWLVKIGSGKIILRNAREREAIFVCMKNRYHVRACFT